eukprot:17590-Chlamydomonas_euryale.AAC.11
MSGSNPGAERVNSATGLCADFRGRVRECRGRVCLREDWYGAGVMGQDKAAASSCSAPAFVYVAVAYPRSRAGEGQPGAWWVPTRHVKYVAVASARQN